MLRLRLRLLPPVRNTGLSRRIQWSVASQITIIAAARFTVLILLISTKMRDVRRGIIILLVGAKVTLGLCIYVHLAVELFDRIIIRMAR